MREEPEVPSIFDHIFRHISEKGDHLVPALRRRMSCEKWLHIEAFHVLESLSDSSMIDSYIPEREYPTKQGRCDLYIKTKGTDAWIEFEVVVTNYGAPGKPITQQVQHVVEDARRLRDFIGCEKSWICCWVYPLASDGSNDEDWKAHLDKMKSKGGLTESMVFSIALPKGWSARAYLFRFLSGVDMHVRV